MKLVLFDWRRLRRVWKDSVISMDIGLNGVWGDAMPWSVVRYTEYEQNRGVHPPRPMMHIAYSPYFHKIYKCHPFCSINVSCLIYVSLPMMNLLIWLWWIYASCFTCTGCPCRKGPTTVGLHVQWETRLLVRERKSKGSVHDFNKEWEGWGESGLWLYQKLQEPDGYYALVQPQMFGFDLCRSVFSHGLPVQFSFAATLRMTDQTAQKPWDVLRIEDGNQNLQFSIHINGRKKSVRLKFMNNRNKLRAAEFSLDNQYFGKVCWSICHIVVHILTFVNFPYNFGRRSIVLFHVFVFTV